MILRLLACATVVAVAGSAQAALFSFASDVDSSSFTFFGWGNAIVDAQDPSDTQLLFIDDDNGVLPTLPVTVEFDAVFEMAYAGSIPVTGNTFVHTYALAGAFGFFDPDTGAPILTAALTGGSLTALGSATSWGTSETIQVNDIGASEIVYTWWGPAIPAYGLYPGNSIGPDDAAFTLTLTLSAAGAGVPLDPQTGLPAIDWVSEGSYSGSAFFIPTPGAAALAGLGLIGMARRRR